VKLADHSAPCAVYFSPRMPVRCMLNYERELYTFLCIAAMASKLGCKNLLTELGTAVYSRAEFDTQACLMSGKRLLVRPRAEYPKWAPIALLPTNSNVCFRANFLTQRETRHMATGNLTFLLTAHSEDLIGCVGRSLRVHYQHLTFTTTQIIQGSPRPCQYVA
jgi:hypothetical protein